MTADLPQSEPGPAGTQAGRIAAVVVLLGLALTLRLVGITWGLPDDTHLFSYHPDEYHSLRGAISMALGDPNPHFFNYGSLYLYLVGIAAALFRPEIFAALPEATPGGALLPVMLREWTLIARIVTVLLATATVAVVYATAARIWGHREGLAAGLLLTLAPLHLLHSHYATVDVPGAFFVALALYFSVALVDRPDLRGIIWAGIATGLAASVKYSGAVAIVAPLAAWLIVWQRDRGTDAAPRWTTLVALPVAALAAFALTSPFTVLDWQSAWRDISFEMAHMRVGDDPAMLAIYPSGPAFYLRELMIGTGGIMPVAALIGLVAGLLAGNRALWPLLLLGLAALSMTAGTEVRYARYLMPLLPVIAILAAGVVSVDQIAAVRGRLPVWGIAIGVAIILAGAALGAAVLDRRLLHELRAEDPHAEALALLEERVPSGGSIGFLTEPWFYHPPVDYCNGGVMLREHPLWGAYRRPIRELRVIGLDADALFEQRPDAVVLTGFELAVKLAAGDPTAARFMRVLNDQQYEPVNSPQGLAWNWASPRPWAQDWFYPYPWIELWVRSDTGSPPSDAPVTGEGDGGMIDGVQ